MMGTREHIERHQDVLLLNDQATKPDIATGENDSVSQTLERSKSFDSIESFMKQQQQHDTSVALQTEDGGPSLKFSPYKGQRVESQEDAKDLVGGCRTRKSIDQMHSRVHSTTRGVTDLQIPGEGDLDDEAGRQQYTIRHSQSARDAGRSGLHNEHSNEDTGGMLEMKSASFTSPLAQGGVKEMHRSKSGIDVMNDHVKNPLSAREDSLESMSGQETLRKEETHPANDASVRRQTLGSFVFAELQPSPVYPTTDVVWGQTERDRVYNALISVPYQFERLVAFGNTVCLTSFLSIFTLLPLRVLSGVGSMLVLCLQKFHVVRKDTLQRRKLYGVRLRGDQLFDMICILIFGVMVLFLWHLKAGAIYFWVKELTQEFLKLSVLHTALELGDKICCSFGVDVLEALAASCTLVSSEPNRRNVLNVLSDAFVALLLLVTHAGMLMSQALVYGVAMNSQKNTLLALLIASNFTEIKGTVLKRFDPTKLFVLACQDVVERFHLLIILSFVLVEEATGLGQPLPSTRLIWQCCYVIMAEVVIDVTKHAVLGKFNDIRPGVYQEFTRDLCENIGSSQSHTMHKLVGLEPFASAALFFRVAISFVSLQKEIFSNPASGTSGTVASMALYAILLVLIIIVWLCLSFFTLLLGYVLKTVSFEYLRRYEAWRSKTRGGRVWFPINPKHTSLKTE